MKVWVRYSAVLNIEDVKNGNPVEVSPGTSITQLLIRCKVKEEHHRYLLVYVNGEKRGLSYVLRDNDQLQLFLPTGGG